MEETKTDSGTAAAGARGNPSPTQARRPRLLERAHVRFKRLLGPDGDLKIWALAVAFLLFQAIHPKVTATAVFDVPVTPVSDNARCLATGVEPETVKVTVRGPADAVASLGGANISVRAVSSNPEFLSRETVPLEPPVLSGSGRVRVVSVWPSKAEVRLDRLGNWVTTNYVAQPRLEGQPLQSHAAVIMPTDLEVKAFGSIKQLEEFSRKGIRLPTSSIDVEGKTQTFSANVEIKIPPDSGITSLSPSNFTVTVELTPIRLRNIDGGTASTPTVLSQEEAEAMKAAPAHEGQEAAPGTPVGPVGPASTPSAARGNETPDGATPAPALAGELLTPEEKEAAAAPHPPPSHQQTP